MNNFHINQYTVRKFRRYFHSKCLAVVLGIAIFSTLGSNHSTGQPIASIRGTNIQHPDWAKNATIYEVNIRQYSPEGTFRAFSKDIPRLKKMGVEIIWLMPIHPIGKKNRKGKLGSPYSVRNYKAINPNFGTLSDLKRLVQTAHNNDMKVILDWVANHTAWDNVWTKAHPSWFTKDESGHFKPPNPDWDDVIDLNYNNRAMRDTMIADMKYWINKTNIDGYRCDYAMGVPVDFWNRARKELDAIKPVFMLAEAEQADLQQKAFDMSYAWNFYDLTNKIAKGNAGPENITNYMTSENNKFPADSYRMYFTSNHDENFADGTPAARYGNALKAMAVLTSTLDGMPLIYNGQEAANNERLAFFKKDTLHWDGYQLEDFYTKLFQLNQNNPAMWNGTSGGNFERVKTSNDDAIFAYKHVKNSNEVLVILNLTNKKQSVRLNNFSSTIFTEIFSDKKQTVGSKPINLNPWGYRVLVK